MGSSFIHDPTTALLQYFDQFRKGILEHSWETQAYNARFLASFSTLTMKS